jgi:hypothetical protein
VLVRSYKYIVSQLKIGKSMKKITRRQAVKALGAATVTVSSGTLLSACGDGPQNSQLPFAGGIEKAVPPGTSVNSISPTASSSQIVVAANVSFSVVGQQFWCLIFDATYQNAAYSPVSSVPGPGPAGVWTATVSTFGSGPLIGQALTPGSYHTRVYIGAGYGSYLDGPDVVVPSAATIQSVSANVVNGVVTVSAQITLGSIPQTARASLISTAYNTPLYFDSAVTPVQGAGLNGTWTGSLASVPPGLYATRVYLGNESSYSPYLDGPIVTVGAAANIRVFDMSPTIQDGTKRPQFGWPAYLDCPPNKEIITDEIILTNLNATATAAAITALTVNGTALLRKNQGVWAQSIAVTSGDRIQLKFFSAETLGASVTPYVRDTLPLGDAVAYSFVLARTTNRVSRSPQTFQVGSSRTYKTLADVMPFVFAGDTVEVDSGVYAGTVRWTQSGAQSLPITIKKAPGSTTRPRFIASAANTASYPINAVIGIVNADYIVLDGLEIQWFATGTYNPDSPPGKILNAADLGGVGIPQPYTTIGVNPQGHGIEIKDCYIHDCHDLVLSYDATSGSLLIESCFGERSGAVPNSTISLNTHGYYVTSNQILFHMATVKIIGGYLRNIASNGIKSRAAYLTVAYLRIEMGAANSNYAIQCTGPQGPDAANPHGVDIIGCIIQPRPNQTPIFIGGDGTSINTKINARVTKNTFLLPPNYDVYNAGTVKTERGLRSVAVIDNAVLMANQSQSAPPLLFERDTQWFSGRKFLSVKNGLPAIPPFIWLSGSTNNGGPVSTFADTSSFAVTNGAIASFADGNVARTATSPLNNGGTDLTLYQLPTGFEVQAMALEPFTRRAPSTPPTWPVKMVLTTGSPSATTVGAV